MTVRVVSTVERHDLRGAPFLVEVTDGRTVDYKLCADRAALDAFTSNPAMPDRSRRARTTADPALESLDANCNTCVHLRRVPHAKMPDGQLFGECLADGKPLAFYPGDPMFMDCWKSRREQ